MAKGGWINPGATGGTPGDTGNGGGFDSEPIDPATVGGSASGGSGGSDGDDSGPDAYARNPDGSVKRNKDGSPRKRRGRKPGGSGGGSGGGNRAKSADDLKRSVDNLTQVLGLVHMGLAQVTVTPELALTEDEARQLSAAAVPVLDLFDFAPDPRYIAIGALVVTAGQIYVPRAVAINARRKAARAKPAPAPVAAPFPMADNVRPIVTPQPGPGFADFGAPVSN